MAHTSAWPSLTDRIQVEGIPVGISPVCLGPVAEPRDVRMAHDLGINCFVVSADLHWPRYEALRLGIVDLVRRDASAREQIVLIAVSYSTNPKFCHTPFLELLEALPGIVGVDLSAMGAVNHSEFLARWYEHQKHLRGTVPGVKGLAAFCDEPLSAFVATSRRMVELVFIPYRRNPTATHGLLRSLASGCRSPRLLHATGAR